VKRRCGKRCQDPFPGDGEVISNYRKRPEAIRLKHQCKSNSVKVYDKQGSILQVDTTINRPYDFKLYWPKEGDPNGPLDWRKMRQGIADLYLRAQVSGQSNERYLAALASVDTGRPLREILAPVCRRVRWKGRPMRALRPWSEQDRTLLSAIIEVHAMKGKQRRGWLSVAEAHGVIFAHKSPGGGRDVESGVLNAALCPSFQTTA